MGRKLYPSDVLDQAIHAHTAWKLIDEGLTIGVLNVTELAANIESIQQTRSDIQVLETRLTDLRNQRDALILSAWDKVKRMRAGIKGVYGDDSSEYEMVGCTRQSERRKTRKSPALE
ncbi:MAG TPA: hypothetical protein VJ785_08310 [Anaerolineales bacterium]|nr:hypothetical protein [Anaerolineales bacterium]